MTHENARAVSAVGIGIGVAVAIAIGRHFDIDSDSEPDTDSDPEIPSEHSIFGTAPHAPVAHPVTHENGSLPDFEPQSPTPSPYFRCSQGYQALVSNQNTIGDGRAGDGCFPNFSAQRILPVICITTKRVTMAPMVMESPVKPLKKKA